MRWAFFLLLGGCAASAASSTTDAKHDDVAPATTSSAAGDTTGAVSSTASPTNATSSAATDAGSDAPASCTRAAGYFANRTIKVGSETRTYDLFVPASASALLPVVLVFHGDDGVSLRDSLGLEKVTGTGAIVAYPHGNDGAWNLGKADGNDDYAFVDALKAELDATYCGDPARTFGFGMSNGGFFLNQVACYRGTATFKAIVSHSGGLYAPDGVAASYGDNGGLLCPAPAPAVLVIHGQSDNTVPYATGTNTRDSWLDNDSCNAGKTTGFAPSPCATYACTKNAVGFCGVPNLGHALWSNAAAATWSFLAKL